MKRFILGLVVLSRLLGVGAVVSVLFEFVHEPTADYLEDAAQASLAGDWDKARELFDQAQERWEDWRDFTAAFSDHGPMDEIEGLFSQLEVYAVQKNYAYFPALCAKLASLAQAMADSHRLQWWTLL